MGEFLQAKEEQSRFIRQHYRIQVFFEGVRENIISQMRMLLVNAINKNRIFPKIILVVLDDDLLRDINHDHYGITHILGTTLMWLATEFHKIILAHKESLLPKSKKEAYPTVLWAAAPLHKNFTLKPPNRITGDKLRLAIWDTSFWTFWLKFGHRGP